MKQLIVGVAMLLVLMRVAEGANTETYWQHDPSTPGDWHVESNWSNGLPDAYKSAVITNGGTAVHETGSSSADRISVGSAVLQHTDGTITAYGRVTVGGPAGSVGRYELGPTATLLVCDDMHVGERGEGSFIQNGGNVELDWSDRYLHVGYTGSGNGRYEISSGAFSAKGMNVGMGGTGTLIQSGGTVSTAYGVNLGDGDYSLSGTGELHAADIRVGYGGDGGFVQDGGHVDTSYFYMAMTDSSTGTYSLNDGRIDANQEYIGWEGSADATQTGGVNDCVRLSLGRWSDSVGTYSISGGTLDVERFLFVGREGVGRLNALGAEATITAGNFEQNGSSTLNSTLDASGISLLDVTGQAQLAGTWIVNDNGAGLGRFDVLTANGGIVGEFDSVILPSGNWKWGIDDDTALWVEHVPEPSTFALLCMAVGGFLAHLRRRR